MWGRCGWREAGIWDGCTALRRGEEGGAGPDWRGGGGLAKEKRRKRRQGEVPLIAMGVLRPAAQKCRKELYKAADVHTEVRSVLRLHQKRMGLTC